MTEEIEVVALASGVRIQVRDGVPVDLSTEGTKALLGEIARAMLIVSSDKLAAAEAELGAAQGQVVAVKAKIAELRAAHNELAPYAAFVPPPPENEGEGGASV